MPNTNTINIIKYPNRKYYLSKRIYTLTMTKFSETFREPEPGDAS